MNEIRVRIDDETARHIQVFADSIDIDTEEAATRLLRIAANVREIMELKGLLAAGASGEYVVSFEPLPDGGRHVDFRRID